MGVLCQDKVSMGLLALDLYFIQTPRRTCFGDLEAGSKRSPSEQRIKY